MPVAKYRPCRRDNGIYYREDIQSGAQVSLRTREKHAAQEQVRAANESVAQPTLNLDLARIYLQAHDAESTKRTWQMVMAAYTQRGRSSSQIRRDRAFMGRDFDPIRGMKIVETKAEHLLQVLATGKSSVNSYLRRLVHYAENLGWLRWMIMAPAAWPKPRKGKKRGVTTEEHARIIAAEQNSERRAYYQMLWLTGGSQRDVALLQRENFQEGILTYQRSKLAEDAPPCSMRIGPAMVALLATLPQSGWMFPRIAERETSKPLGDSNQRAAEFARRCRLLAITGISLHSYRYSWAGRAAKAGYPQRFAQAALGHKNAGVHNSYHARELVVVPSLEDYENQKIIAFPTEDRDSPGQVRSK